MQGGAGRLGVTVGEGRVPTSGWGRGLRCARSRDEKVILLQNSPCKGV